MTDFQTDVLHPAIIFSSFIIALAVMVALIGSVTYRLSDEYRLGISESVFKHLSRDDKKKLLIEYEILHSEKDPQKRRNWGEVKNRILMEMVGNKR